MPFERGPFNGLSPARALISRHPSHPRALPDELNRPQRAFVCQTLNPWGYPAKDRSGRLDLVEEPHLGRLMEKIRGPLIPAERRLTYAPPQLPPPPGPTATDTHSYPTN